MTAILIPMAPPNVLQLMLSLSTINIFGVLVTSLPQEHCPEQCLCSETPQRPGKLVVNCTDAALSAIPTQLPLDTVELHFSKNPLFRVDFNSFDQLSELEKLDFSGCYLRTVNSPGDVHEQLPHLTVVDLSDNDLDNIPQNLPRSIHKLYLSHNSIAAVSNLSHLSKLTEVFLDNNHISALTPNAFLSQSGNGERLSNLDKLALHSNRISTIDSEAFNGLASLSALTLSNNYIRQVDKDMFENLTNLHHLDLSQNSLTQLPPGMFRSITHLKYLDLSRNHLSSFPIDIPMLEWLDISQNTITHIAEESKPDVYPIEVLNLAKNPFICDCHLLWLKQIFERREYLVKHLNIAPEDFIPTCRSPPSLAGKSWNQLEDDAFECQEGSHQPRARTADTATETDIAVRARAGLVTDSTVQVIWSVDSLSYTGTNIIIQYYVFGHRASMKYVEIAVAQKEFVLKHLKSMTNYVICLIPKASGSRNEQGNPSIVLENCIEVATKEARPVPQASRMEIVFYYTLGMFATFIGIFATIGGCALLYGLWNHKNTHWSARYVTEDSYLDGSTYATDEPVSREKKQHRD